MHRNPLVALGVVAVLLLSAWWVLQQKDRPVPAPVPMPVEETIPPGIVVTESTTAAPPPPAGSGSAPGDGMLAGYADPALPPQNDVLLMARAISNFLLIDKQAAARPLSANEEWSAALRGLRSGGVPWISARQPVFDSGQRLIDRWSTPLIFHALGGRQWEIRSAGPDRKPWTADDLIEKFSG